eukprot:1724624-Pyramimonas_sp.AAC.1
MLLDGVQRPNYETLRRSRVRLDCVAMLLTRTLLRQMGREHNMYLFTDSSPQWMGLELFASSYDMISYSEGATHFTRRLLPVTTVKHYMLGARMKVFSLLWQIALVSGMSITQIRRFCRRVRSVTTDFGTERLIADATDMVPDFCRSIGSTVPEGVLRDEFTFPRALYMAGWRHIFDTLLKRACCSLKWFPKFLEQLKAVSRFLRNHREEVCGVLRGRGFAGVASMVESETFP